MNVLWVKQLQDSLRSIDVQIKDYESRIIALKHDREGTLQQLYEAQSEMGSIVFKWVDTDGPNQQVCTTYKEVIEFVRMNDGIKFTVETWER